MPLRTPLAFASVLLLLVSLALRSHAQGGSLGGSGGRTTESDLTTATNVLTPGQQSEWALTIKEGEAILATATTTNFDPAIQIVDAGGTVLAENDDVRLGVQDAVLLYRFPKAGAYKLRVKAFKGAGGGQFQLTLRRFVARPLPLGTRTTSAAGAPPLQFYRLSAEAGQTVLVSLPVELTNPQVFSPSGESLPLERPLDNRPSTVVFRAETKGEYYLRLVSPQPYAFTAAVARVTPLTLGQPTLSRKLGNGGIDLWTFPAEEGDVVRVQARAEGTGVELQLRYLPPTDSLESDSEKETPTLLSNGPKTQGELVAVLRKTGTYELTLAQPLGQETDYTLTTTRAVRAWTPGAALAGTLALGTADYYTLAGKAGELLQLEGASEQFDVELELFNAQGERITSNDDGGKGRNALLTALLKKTEKYLLRVHCFGDGGSGAYQLRAASNPVRPLQRGERGSGTLNTGSTEIWSFQGKAGEALILSAHAADFSLGVQVFGPDGIEISTSNRGDTTRALFGLTLPLNGTYTFWVSSRVGAGKYTLRLIEADS